mgnify:FL=1
MSYNNPFMISRHLNPRASGLIVFGGGGGGADPGFLPGESSGPIMALPQTPAPVAPTPITSSYPELSGTNYTSDVEKQTAEAAVDKDRATIKQYTTDVNAAISAAGAGLDEIAATASKIQAANSVTKPGVTYGGESLNTFLTGKVTTLQQKLSEAQTNAQAKLASGARQLTSQAVTDPSGLATTAAVDKIDPNTAGTTITQGTGQLPGTTPGVDVTTAGPAAVSTGPTEISATGVTAATGQPAIADAMAGTTAAQGEISAASVAQAATTDASQTGVMDLTAQQGTATLVSNPVQRQIQAGELISGTADAVTAAAFTEQVQAATATPSEKATVQGQLTELMQDFEGGNTPAWAAGALRNATAQMAARGLGASSMAGQALVQAAMESALPIAIQDAQTVAGFEMTNLSNRQQRAMLSAQQRAQFMGMEFDQAFQSRVQNSARIADIANMNFTAEQSIALENSRAANTMGLANLSNGQAMVMAQAASISQLESQNLSNQQQAAVQNAQAFLQMDMTNLSNRQQTDMFKTQTIAQSILTDQAAENAAKQFNASSENQTKQFMANMQTQVTQFNATQINATNQFNAGQENAAEQFNANIENQRDQFNAQNSLVIAQANAQWRQNIATLDSAAQNEANVSFAQSSNAFTQSTLDQLWQRERDIMDYVYKASESSMDRALSTVLADKKYAENQVARDDAEETSKWQLFTSILLA